MIIIGIDPHKTSHTAVAVDQREQPVGQLTVLAGPRPLLGCWPGPSSGRSAAGRWRAPAGWATTWPQQLVGAGEQFSDVHPKLATRVRLLDRGLDARLTRSTPARSRWSPCAPHPDPARCGR